MIRAVVVTYAAATSWLYFAFAIAIGAVVLFGMTALHLANYTPRRWVWRAPAFGLCEGGAEMLVSAFLTFVGREPVGTGQLEMSQWWGMATFTIVSRTLMVSVFAMMLAVVVQVARRIAIAREPNARAAASLRAELFSDAPERDIDRTHAG